MPAFAQSAGGELTDAQIDALVAGTDRARGDARMRLETPTLPPYAAGARATPARGKAVYAAACAGCHGPEGEAGRRAGSIVDPSYLALVSDQGAAHDGDRRPPRSRHARLARLRRRAAPDARSRSPTSSPGSSAQRRPVPGRLSHAAIRDRGHDDGERTESMCADHEPLRRRRPRAAASCSSSALALNVLGGRPGRDPGDRLHPRPRAPPRRPGVDPARTASRASPTGETRLAIYENPFSVALGRRDGEDRVLGAPRRRRAVPGLRGQLRAPRLPGALVPAVAALHVPLPRRRLLRGRLARLGAAAARAVRVRVPRSATGSSGCAAASSRRSRSQA